MPSTKTVRIQGKDKADLVLHELGHRLEHTVSNAKRAANSFHELRVGSEPSMPLRSLFPNHRYGRREFGQGDEWDRSYNGIFSDIKNTQFYTGKVYGGRPGDVGRSTEIVSMGLQAMYRDPVRFASNDPEFFKLILAILRGRF